MDNTDLGDTIKRRREVLKLKQLDLAQLSEVALRTIINIENGHGNPSLETLQKIADVLGMKVYLGVKDN